MRFQVGKGMDEYLSKLGLRQLHIAETEKYAHVTFLSPSVAQYTTARRSWRMQ